MKNGAMLSYDWTCLTSTPERTKCKQFISKSVASRMPLIVSSDQKWGKEADQ